MAKKSFDLNVAAAAKAVGTSPATIRRLAKAGELPYRLKGFGPKRKKFYFNASDCDRLRRDVHEGIEPVICR